MRKIRLILVCMMLSCVFWGCKSNSVDEEQMKTRETSESYVIKNDNPEYIFDDNKALYENDDETSVVTMYLTVTKGNATESTNHTWTEVNSHSTYYYEDLGIERYGVNGLLQVGDEKGPKEGELGYGRFSPNAIVTVRGQSSSYYNQKNYKIALSDGVGTFRDQKTINLNKHEQDGLRFRNKMAYDLMKQIPGMMSLRTQFVHLYVKDLTEKDTDEFVDYGLYTQVEQPNKTFLKMHGLDKNGHLYKINFFEFLRYEDVIKTKNEAGYDEKEFEKLIEIKGNDDHSKLISLLDDVNDPTVSGSELLDKWFDVDNITTWMSFMILTGNIDTQSRNLYIYSPQNVNKWYLIAWDNDDNFGSTENRLRNYQTEVGWEKGISNYWGNMLFRKLLQDDSYLEALDKRMMEMKEFLSPERLSPMIENYKSVVKEYAYSPVDAINEPVTPEQYDAICQLLPLEVEENYKQYLNSYNEPMPFFIGVPYRDGKDISIEWDNAYDLNNEDVLYSFELANDLNFENIITKEEGIFIPKASFSGDLQPGQYFIRIKATNKSGYSQYAFDYYVDRESIKHYGIISMYVMPDGSLEVSEYDE